jgi:cell shape-determining protein MreD
MNAFRTMLVLITAFLAVFWETAFPGIRHWIGAQIDLLPPLMVYASLCTSLATVALLAVLGGLWFDSLSANPLGVSIFPLFIVGFVVYLRRELILRDQPLAQFVLGIGASAIVPMLTLVLLLSSGRTPLLGWGSVWQWIAMGLAGATATPILFQLFAWSNRTLGYRPVTETTFRLDREIRRGRV